MGLIKPSVAGLDPNAVPGGSSFLASRLYSVYYFRPGDWGGVAYWAARINAEGLTATIRAAFGNSQEAYELYGGMTNGNKVDAIYGYLFGRTPDAAGRAWYVSQLDSGAITAADAAWSIADGAAGNDKTLLDMKIRSGQRYTIYDKLVADANSGVTPYTGQTGQMNGRSFQSSMPTYHGEYDLPAAKAAYDLTIAP